ncbi:MAG: aminopeptidase [Deltaproteobacteria bacterium]|nr:aminopeptidase [Deltaproteobacteria bacterium]
MRRALLVLLLSLPAPAQELSPELQITLTSLRAGERARLEKAVGRLDELPLYRADLDFDPKARTVTGKVFITWTAKGEALDELYLRVHPNASNAGAVSLTAAAVNRVPAKLTHPDASLYRLAIDPPIPVGAAAEVELRLEAKVPHAPAGSDAMTMSAEGAGDFGAFSTAPEITSLVGLLPGVAPRNAKGELMSGPSGIGDLGTFDPSCWLVSLTVPSGYTVVAPGNAVGEVPERNGRTRFSYALAGARELPLLVTKGYKVATKTVGDVTVESHYFEADAKSGKAVLEHAAAALKHLDAKLGPYPYTRLRVVEARLAGGAGGMEFPGLVTVGTSLYRGAADPLEALGMGSLGADPLLGGLLAGLKPLMENTLEFTVAHEVAHQYFAMLVGSDPVDEPVVDEALTQHAALLVLEWQRGRKAADGMRDGQLKLAYQANRLMGGEDAVANQPTNEFGSTRAYAAAVYGKAPLLFDEVRKEVGAEAWLKALRTYVEEYRYKWARPRTIFEVVAQQSPRSAKKVEALRRHWWDEKHGDKDIGTGNLEQLLGGALGPAGSGPVEIDPALKKQLEELIKMLEGKE